MAATFDPDTVFVLWSGNIPGYNFIDIWLDGPYYAGHPNFYFPDIHLCDWIRDVQNPIKGIKQVDVKEHNVESDCKECHNPHSP